MLNGFKQNIADQYLFKKNGNNEEVLIILYVYDISIPS